MTERKAFPGASLIVGSPATVKRLLTGAEIASLRQSAQTYVAKGALFRSDLERVD